MRTIILNLITLTFFSISLNGQIFNSQAKDNTLIVEGVAIIKEVPKDIFAVITIKAESKTYSECQDELLNKIEIIKSSILRNNISKDLIKTNEISINIKNEYIDGKNEKTGFTGNISLSIETSFSLEFAGKLLNALKIDSLGVEYNIKFELSEDQKSNLRQEAINLAVVDAKEKAMFLAKSSNIKLIKINSISYQDEGNIFARDRDIIREDIHPITEAFMFVGSPNDMTKSIDFNPKEIGIYKSVQIEWIIEDETKKN